MFFRLLLSLYLSVGLIPCIGLGRTAEKKLSFAMVKRFQGVGRFSCCRLNCLFFQVPFLSGHSEMLFLIFPGAALLSGVACLDECVYDISSTAQILFTGYLLHRQWSPIQKEVVGGGATQHALPSEELKVAMATSFWTICLPGFFLSDLTYSPLKTSFPFASQNPASARTPLPKARQRGWSERNRFPLDSACFFSACGFRKTKGVALQIRRPASAGRRPSRGTAAEALRLGPKKWLGRFRWGQGPLGWLNIIYDHKRVSFRCDCFFFHCFFFLQIWRVLSPIKGSLF